MSIEQLKKLLPPPSKPFHNVVDWKAVEAMYGIAVPDDFKDLIQAYGSGSINGFLCILNPREPSTNVNFDKSEYFIEAYKTMKGDFPQDFPRAPYSGPHDLDHRHR